MYWRHGLAMAFSLGTLVLATHTAQGQAKKIPVITWKKTVLDRAFRSEGVAVADVNKDGKPDVIVGDIWYEAPDWKVQVIRKDRTFKAAEGYSECFGVFADDFNGDGWVDVLILPFPGAPCYWYENPGNTGGPWREHMLSHSACNETPLYADLFGDGKRVLVMGVQPKGQENMGQMFWLRPGKDPTQLWEHHPISVPSEKGKIVPGTFRYSHGLGVGDVNGDGRNDVICTGGWWQQPEDRTSNQPWKFHPVDLGPDCADMFAIDIDGDGRNDIVSTSAHNFGMWWHQQRGSKENPSFLRNEMFPGVDIVADPRNYRLTDDEKKLLDLLNGHRATKNLRPIRAVPFLCRLERGAAENKRDVKLEGKFISLYKSPKSEALMLSGPGQRSPETMFKTWLENGAGKTFLDDWQEVGVGFFHDKDDTKCALRFGNGRTSPAKGIVVWDGMKKQLVGQTHALHLVDINGDGVKDLVTGRRFWAHGPRGDAAPTEPTFLFWFEGKRGKDGIMTFLPHVIDDDSGIATQFSVADINGDGLLDVVISNKKGVFVFEQVRTPAVDVPRRD
jgi:hypothetical protein